MEEALSVLAEQQQGKHNCLQMDVPMKGKDFLPQKLVSAQELEG